MHHELAAELVKQVRQRIKDGDSPTFEPLSTETLEGLVDELARQLEQSDTSGLREALEYVEGMLGEFGMFGAVKEDFVRVRAKVKAALLAVNSEESVGK